MNPTIYNFKEEEVRAIFEEEQTWFVAKDVCDILGLSEVSKFMERIDEDEKLMRKLFVSGQQRDTWTINEFGLYTLILTSNKPEAKQFKRWITHEILPAIRKAGKFTTEEQQQLEAENQAIIKLMREHQNSINDYKSSIRDLKSRISELSETLEQNITNPQKQPRLNFKQ